MRDQTQPDVELGSQRAELQSSNTGLNHDLDRRFYTALVSYAILGALAWFTLGEGRIFVGGRAVELRMVPLVILGGFALRTVLGLYAERIRRGGEKGGK